MGGAAPGARELRPSTASIRRGATPSACASRVPAAVVIETSSSSASSHVAGARDCISVSTTRSARLTSGAGTFERSGHFTPYTAISNVTGSPAISLPLYARDDGLPLAVQLIGRPAQEGALLALAAQVEAAAPWAGRRPPLAAA